MFCFFDWLQTCDIQVGDECVGDAALAIDLEIE